VGELRSIVPPNGIVGQQPGSWVPSMPDASQGIHGRFPRPPRDGF
jgi:hypothetical protein